MFSLDRLVGDEESYSLSHRILNIILLFGNVLAILSIVFNYFMNFNAIITGTCATSGGVLGILYYLSLVKREYYFAAYGTIFVFIFVLTPVLWFANGGILGATSFFISVFATALALMVRGTKRVLTIGGLVLVILLMIIIQYYFPGIVNNYNSEFDRYIDVSFSLLVTIVANTSLVVVLMNYYVKEQGRARDYLTEIEKQKIEIEMSRLDRLNLIGEMAASIGHEVRNPLTTVRGFLQLFLRREDNTRQNEYYHLMISELDRANSIITEFLSLARNRVIDLQPASLNSIINSLYPLINASVLSEDKTMSLRLGQIPEVLADENEIKQLFLNITRNAREAVSAGGLIIVSTYQENDGVVLSVADDGTGMPPEVIAKLGTPFFTTKEMGTGLGLAICYRIVERHRAKISIESSTAGTTFSIKFNVYKGEKS